MGGIFDNYDFWALPVLLWLPLFLFLVPDFMMQSTVFLKELDTMDPFHKATWLRWLDAGRRVIVFKIRFL